MVAAVSAWQPWLATGLVMGGMVVWITTTWPMVVVGAMLALGPLDLSFLTGGFKELFPELGGLDMNGIRLLGISAGLLVVIATDRGILASLLSGTARWYVAFLAFAAATLAWSPDPLEGARLLFKLAYPLLVFLVVSAPGRTEAEVVRLADWALLGALVLLLVNPAFVATGSLERDFEGRLRLGGAGSHQNPFSFYLLVIILLCAARYAVRGQVRYLLLAGLAATWMALTLTRITVGAAVVGLFAMGLYGALVNRNYRAAAFAVASAVLLAAALSPMVLARSFYGRVPSPGELLGLLGDPIALFQAVNWQGRQVIWPILLQAWSSSPWIGLGLGSSTVVIATAFPSFPIVAHNEYLRLGVDAGWIGVVLFFLAVMAWLRAALRVGRTGHPSVREHALPALAGILAWGVIAITDNSFDYYGSFTQFIGFFAAAAVVAARQGPSRLDPPPTAR
jgi:O-antigen ligase